MTVQPPPIQEPVQNELGRFTNIWVRWLNSLKLSVDSRVVWFDYNDTATSVTPISHTGGATNTYLTNDGLGAFSNSYNLVGYADIWDASSGEFDFTGLKMGDAVVFRVDLVIETSVNNQEFDVVLDLGIGSGDDYTLNCIRQQFKSQEEYQITFMYEIYMGNDYTINFPAKLRFESAQNANITVNGWYTRLVIA